jgi:hypothetical protein
MSYYRPGGYFPAGYFPGLGYNSGYNSGYTFTTPLNNNDNPDAYPVYYVPYPYPGAGGYPYSNPYSNPYASGVINQDLPQKTNARGCCQAHITTSVVPQALMSGYNCVVNGSGYIADCSKNVTESGTCFIGTDWRNGGGSVANFFYRNYEATPDGKCQLPTKK